MNRPLPKPIIAGNWKLNHGPSAARDFIEAFEPLVSAGRRGTLALFPPAISIPAAREALADGSPIRLGVQNIYWEGSGAYTGEISGEMARDAGAELVLVGHSERRHVFGETDEDTARKVQAALAAGLTVVLCVGELIEERESGDAKQVVDRQLDAVLEAIPDLPLDRFIIAYEPVWAIGTGKTATPEDAAEMHGSVRSRLVARYGEAGRSVPVLYGGSVKPDNAAELLRAQEVDGLLVGGASLVPASFAAIWDARP